MMSAALDDGYLPPALAAADCEGEPEVPRLTQQQQITHEQIIGAIGRLEGLVEAEAEARREFRADLGQRFLVIDQRIGNVGLEVQQLRHQMGSPQARPEGVIHAVLLLFERQPLLAVVIAGTLLALGSGGVVAIWEAFQK